jgi:hypothetical protein
MEALSFEESIPLISALYDGVMTAGIQESLDVFGEAGSRPENRCAGSIAQNLLAGNDFQTSFLHADPLLPDPLSGIIIAGYLNSVLDHALEDISDALASPEHHACIYERLLSLEEKYNRCSASEICQVCFERELRDLLSQARALSARIAQLEQIGESFLNQYFIATELAKFVRPSHSLVYRTFQSKFEAVCEGDGILRVEHQAYHVEKTDLATYSIWLDNEEVLQVVFKGIQ